MPPTDIDRAPAYLRSTSAAVTPSALADQLHWSVPQAQVVLVELRRRRIVRAEVLQFGAEESYSYIG